MPHLLILDNTRTTTINKYNRYETILTKSHQEMVDYYETAIVPAGSIVLMIKQQAEESVRFVSTWITQPSVTASRFPWLKLGKQWLKNWRNLIAATSKDILDAARALSKVKTKISGCNYNGWKIVLKLDSEMKKQPDYWFCRSGYLRSMDSFPINGRLLVTYIIIQNANLCCKKSIFVSSFC